MKESMDQETQKNKKKIKVKGNVKEKLILSKKYLYEEKHSNNKTIPLILNKEFKTNESIKLVNNQIINFESLNQKIDQEILSVKSISKSLGGRPILRDISFSIKPGEILGILGQNGCGKTTLFNCLMGTIYPDSGEIRFNKKIINHLKIHQRSKLGISLIQQHMGLFSNMTVYDNLYAILELHIVDKNKIESKIDSLLNTFNLNYAKNLLCKNLSGGEYKRLCILQRMCNEKVSVILLDEPCAALSPVAIESLKKFLLDLKKMNLAIIITDHQFLSIHELLDKCLVINDGTIMVEGTPKEISRNEKAIRYYLGSNLKI